MQRHFHLTAEGRVVLPLDRLPLAGVDDDRVDEKARNHDLLRRQAPGNGQPLGLGDDLTPGIVCGLGDGENL
jgi:hypothetical protein